VILDENERRTVLDLDKDVLTVGRAADNDVVLMDLKASRHHCRVERHGEQWLLLDLGSQNGTHLNGHLVERAGLKPGDCVGVGGARLWFGQAPPPDSDPGRETQSIDARALGLEGQDRLQRLQRVVRALNSELHVQRLLEIVVDHLVEVSGAERGFLVLVGPDGKAGAQVARNFEQQDVQSPEVAFSTSLVRKVVATGEPILTANAVEDARFADNLSLNAIRARSVMVLPFRVRGTTIGALYVDNRLQKGAFAEAELATLVSLADLAATAIDRARLYEQVERHAHELEDLNRRLELRVEVQERELGDARDRLRIAGEPEGAYPQIIGRSAAMRDVLRLLDKIVQTEEPVLVTGESGTGKELIARAIHGKGPRAKRPFLSENCAALTDTLLESELFGHVRGAFTGADRDKKGLFELADHGTLFLDEVGDMSPDMQKKLLRTLQEGEVRPVGGKSVRKVDVRIVSASNKELDRLVRSGEFREDLYYRLKVLTIRLPPLRQRKEDVPALVEHFLRLHAPRGRRPQRLGAGVMEALVAHDWPGNIRELENEVKRMIALGDEEIGLEVLSDGLRRGVRTAGGAPASDAPVANLVELVEGIERREITRALEQAAGHKTRASDLLGISRFTLQRKLEKYGLEAAGDEG
ncbi:MAG: sigma 54-interacting transcriptional regulator, partial [Planctomycetia bacterium]